MDWARRHHQSPGNGGFSKMHAKTLCFLWPGTHWVQHSTNEWIKYILFNDKTCPYQKGEVNSKVMKTNYLTNLKHQETSLQLFWSRVCGFNTSNFPRCLPSTAVKNPCREGFSRILFSIYPLLWSHIMIVFCKVMCSGFELIIFLATEKDIFYER